LILFLGIQHHASACTVYLGKNIRFDMEISPKVPLFYPDVDGYFYPGSPKITKHLKLINVGDLPFRICRINASFSRLKFCNLAKEWAKSLISSTMEL
jgi:hypothetical protein